MRKGLTCLVVGVAMLAAAGSSRPGHAQARERRAPVVQQDLEAAMKGEAFAYAKYMLFARQARARGHEDLAQLYERTANVERMEHFLEHAQLAGLTESSEVDNLRNAIAGERYETNEMYPEMSARARNAGDRQAAERFAEVGRDESGHREQFAAALAKLEREAHTRSR